MVERIIERFNKVSQWAATVILDTSDLETRCWVMQQFVDVADVLVHLCVHVLTRDQELRLLQNFQGVMAVTSALAITPIRRLTVRAILELQ